MGEEGNPVNLNMLVHARFFCKGCTPQRRFWSEYELVKHIIEERKKAGSAPADKQD